MATKSSIGNLGLNFEETVKSLSRVATTAGQVDKAFAGITGSSSKYIDNITKSLSELTKVSDKLPVTAKALKTIFDSVDSMRVNQQKAGYINGIANSLTKLYVPLQVLSTLNIDPAIDRLDRLMDVFDKVPTRGKVDRINEFSGAIRKFSAASKTLAGIPSNVAMTFMTGGSGGSGGGGGAGYGGGGGRGGGNSPLIPLTLPGGTGGAPVALPSFGGTGVAPPQLSTWQSVVGSGKAALASSMSSPGTMLAVAALANMLKERMDTNEKLGTTVDFSLGIGGRPGSMQKQAMLDKASMLHGISYEDAASLMTSYRKYSSGGLRNTDMTPFSSSNDQKIGNDFEGFAAGSRRLQRQLGIDLDEAGDIQGSSRKNLGMNARQFKEFGDSMAYLSKNAAMSKKEILDLNKEIQNVGIVTGKTGENAKVFAQNMMVAGGVLSEAGVSSSALTSIQKGFSGDKTSYLLNKQTGITSDMKPQEQVMAQQQFVASRLQSLAGMDPETKALQISNMQARGLLPSDMSIPELIKLSEADPATMQKLIVEHTKKIKEEQATPNMGATTLLGSVKNVLGGTFGYLGNLGGTMGAKAGSAFGGMGSDFGKLAGGILGTASAPLTLIPTLVNSKITEWMQDKYGPEKHAAGGIVGGSGESDSVPAMLTPGEEVLRKDDPRHRYNLDTFKHSFARIEGYYAQGKTPNRPQRNMNPGNLRVDADWKHNPEKAMHVARLQGASGYDAQGYLKFDSEEAGFAGLERQMRIDAKRGMNVSSFIEKYAPATENNTAAYKAFIKGKGFGGDVSLSDITGSGGASSRVAALAKQSIGAATTTLSSAGSSIMSHLSNLFNFTQDATKTVSKQSETSTAQVASSLMTASSSNGESADKISQAADVLLQAAQTMSSSIISQSSRGSAEQQYRISNIARGNMVI